MSELQPETVYAEGFFRRFTDVLGPYLTRVGISPEVLQDPSLLVEVPQFVEVMEVAARERAEDFLGLHMGERLRPQDLGVVGYAIAHAATVEHLLRTYVRYFVVYALGVDMRLEVEDNLVSWTYQLADPGIVARRQDAEMALAFIHTVIQRGVGDEWQLMEVHFEHSKPKEVSEHRRIFQAPVLFDKPVNALVFDKRLLDKKLKEADQRLFPALQSHLDSVLLERSEEQDLVAQVSNFIAKSLSTHVPSLAEVAEALGMPTWTLQRRLRDKGLVYSQLVTDTRRRLAEAYLKNADMPLMEVAFLLGYSEVSAFSRAFRRWMGKPPLEYRRALLSDSPSTE